MEEDDEDDNNNVDGDDCDDDDVEGEEDGCAVFFNLESLQYGVFMDGFAVGIGGKRKFPELEE